uniref:NADH-ubiquinone oxidoreductase chain 2 n=1 Tax=Phraortes sp. Iriomote Island TaxID=590991 RepID=E2RUV7_9NEOP|nr:NADH dehydrogenase subunit 2 [Phraortes sp. Iriomote Island]BAJ24491.1 NADH dehydrogenase subunit 2 [Phraortes sp. Iriomote Island]
MNKSTNMLFMIMIIISVMISISSNSWFNIWMGMEINIMSFMPMIINKNNLTSKESSLMYFLIQTMASMLLIMSIMMMKVKLMHNNILMMSALMMKSGVSPFHFWMPKMMEGMNWKNCMMLMPWQKIIPLSMMSSIIKMNMMNTSAIIMSIMVGAIGGLNQTSLRKLMAYSSITNNGWMMMAMMVSEMMWLMYFIMYSIMTFIMTMTMNNYKIFHMNQLMSMNETPTKKLILMMNMLSISGLPPMMGFLPKWMIIQSSLNQNEIMLMITMVMITLITVFYYLRMMYSSMILTSMDSKWKMKTMKNKFIMMINMISLLGLSLMSLMMLM